MKAHLYFDNDNRGFASCQKVEVPHMASIKEALRLCQELAMDHNDGNLHEITVYLSQDRFLSLLVKTGKVIVQSTEGPVLKTWYINQ